MNPQDTADLIRELSIMISRRDKAQAEAAEAARHVDRISSTLCEGQPALVRELAERTGLLAPVNGFGRRRSEDGKLTLTDYAKRHQVDRRMIQKAITDGHIHPPALTGDRFIAPDLADRQLAELPMKHQGKLYLSARKLVSKLPPVAVVAPKAAVTAKPLDPAPTPNPVASEAVEKIDMPTAKPPEPLAAPSAAPAPRTMTRPAPAPSEVAAVDEAPVRERLAQNRAVAPILPGPKRLDPMLADLRRMPSATQQIQPTAMTEQRAKDVLVRRDYEVLPQQKGRWRVNNTLISTEEMIQRAEHILEREERLQRARSA